MEPWQERVIAEHAELKVRMDKLKAFLDSPQSATIAFAEGCRLLEQFKYMDGYCMALNERIKAFVL